jgi:hypothetical protein
MDELNDLLSTMFHSQIDLNVKAGKIGRLDLGDRIEALER